MATTIFALILAQNFDLSGTAAEPSKLVLLVIIGAAASMISEFVAIGYHRLDS